MKSLIEKLESKGITESLGQLSESEVHRYGVKAKRGIKKGEVVETSVLVPLEHLRDYTFLIEDAAYVEELGLTNDSDGGSSCIVSGNGLMYNHSDSPNVDWDQNGGLVSFVAQEDIEVGQEMFIDYGPRWRENGRIAGLESPAGHPVVEAIRVDTSDWDVSHGSRGRKESGAWVFSLGKNPRKPGFDLRGDYVFFANGSYGQSLKKAKAEAKKRDAYVVYVLG
jgi:SET domain-containing protein